MEGGVCEKFLQLCTANVADSQLAIQTYVQNLDDYLFNVGKLGENSVEMEIYIKKIFRHGVCNTKLSDDELDDIIPKPLDKQVSKLFPRPLTPSTVEYHYGYRDLKGNILIVPRDDAVEKISIKLDSIGKIHEWFKEFTRLTNLWRLNDVANIDFHKPILKEENHIYMKLIVDSVEPRILEKLNLSRETDAQKILTALRQRFSGYFHSIVLNDWYTIYIDLYCPDPTVIDEKLSKLYDMEIFARDANSDLSTIYENINKRLMENCLAEEVLLAKTVTGVKISDIPHNCDPYAVLDTIKEVIKTNKLICNLPYIRKDMTCKKCHSAYHTIRNCKYLVKGKFHKGKNPFSPKKVYKTRYK